MKENKKFIDDTSKDNSDIQNGGNLFINSNNEAEERNIDDFNNDFFQQNETEEINESTVDITSISQKSNFILNHNYNSKIISEFYGTARNLLRRMNFFDFAHDSKRKNVITFIASKTKEGASFCAMNTAISMALRHEIKVIYIDTSLNSSVVSMLDSNSSLGLSDILFDDRIPLSFASKKAADSQLYLMNLGSQIASFSQFINSPVVWEKFNEFRMKYHEYMIIIDSPSLDKGLEGIMATSSADEVVLVLKSRDTSSQEVLQSLINISQGNENITVMMNKF